MDAMNDVLQINYKYKLDLRLINCRILIFDDSKIEVLQKIKAYIYINTLISFIYKT